jgi:hypothetical protein
MSVLRSLSATMLLACWAGGLYGQGLTGQISGTVQDSSGAVIADARVTLLNTGTGQNRVTASDDQGQFVFTELLPGTFQLSVNKEGFKKYEQAGIVVTATERVVLRAITMDVGSTTETISVTAEAVLLQTASAERSGLINTKQVQDLGLKGRDYLGLVKLLPGVIDTANREAPGWNNIGGITINGNRSGTINLTLDGVSSLDTGSMTGPYLAPSLDAVAELKVLLTNYQAEYGRSSGGTINTIIKSGSRDFHGGAYYFFRHEKLNANEFFRNRDRQPRPQYRFNYPGYFLGGPVLIPGTGFNKSREKLFFFWSQEFLPRTRPSRLQRLTYPTELERRGDFSQTVDTNGARILIRDPLSGLPCTTANQSGCFQGNVIPANRIDAAGQKLLSIFPLPNTTDPSHTFNSVFQAPIMQPRRDQILRIDWNISSTTQFYARAINDYEAFKGDFDFVLASSIWPQLPIKYQIRSAGLVSTLIHTFSPTLINEFTFGVNRAKQTVDALTEEGLNRNVRSNIGLNLPQFYPSSNPLNLVPQATFVGVQNAPQLNIEQRFPFFGTNNIWNWSDNFSAIRGAHNLKFGVYLEKTTRNAARSTAFNGTFNFDRNTNNPLDSNYAFSNALLGVVNQYTEANGHPSAHARYVNFEWFAQDNWRVTKRFTVDAGVRFYWMQPTWGSNDNFSVFDLPSYDRSKQPALIEPYKPDAATPRQGRNPITGEIVPAVKIGTFASGSGQPYQGMKVYNEKVLETPPIKAAPRIGFGWDVFGNGRTALRGGFGIFFDRFNDDQILQFVEAPPNVITSTAFFTTIRDLLATPLSLSPAGVFAVQRQYDPPTVYNWSFGIQQDLGKRTMFDVAYVGNVARHLLQRRSLNAIPYGARFRPESIDPTTGGPLQDNFLRPFRGYQDIQYIEFASNSNYHSMQTQVNRRLARDFTFGVAWTWSKAMNYVNGNNDDINPYLDYRMRNYGKASYDRTHNFVLNYVYTMPRLQNAPAILKHTVGGWELSGITSFVSGAPSGVSYSLVSGADIVGGSGAGLDTRVLLTGNPVLPRSERSVDRAFRTEVVQPPSRENFGIGNAPKDVFRGPGVNNWDITLLKNFQLGATEGRRLQFRLETYNTFNHAQFSGVDTGARFDANGNQVNARFGQYNATLDARRVVLGMKLYF